MLRSQFEYPHSLSGCLFSLAFTVLSVCHVLTLCPCCRPTDENQGFTYELYHGAVAANPYGGMGSVLFVQEDQSFFQHTNG